ncbi:uncharacterized protein LOC110714748 [Chenopodium quinoa]|uniref:uncharacterized protein LOC110714748 n=1 Tax=Chenopodium quinoa TaxID=63459 RepID=UPI000B76E9AE|nr:uncharacterized protein LOC110714748 [Chenopodium quinoa]
MEQQQQHDQVQQQEVDPNFMYLKFVNQNEKATFIKVLRKSKIAKAFNKYYQVNNIQHGTARFLFNGNRILPTCSATPSDPSTYIPLDIQDGDQIDVVREVAGGAPS